MAQEIRFRNRRKFPRFRATSELFVLHEDFGKIIEIGIGGAAFTYVAKESAHNGHPSLGALFARDDDYLVELPFRTISDTVIHQSVSGKLNIRKRVVVFDDLDDQQLDQLEHFILENVPVTAA